MIMFWTAMVAMMMLALLFLLLPFFYANRLKLADQYEQKKIPQIVFSVKQTNIIGSVVFFTVVLLMLIGAPWFYAQLGAKDELALSLQMKQPITTPEQVVALTEALKHILIKKPDNTSGYYLLAQMYLASDEQEKAIYPLKQLIRLSGESADLLAQLAQAKYVAAHYQMTPETIDLIEKALDLDENHLMALGLKGIAAFSHADYELAISIWERLKVLDNADDSFLDSAINKARQMMTNRQKTVTDG